ncbi:MULTISPECIES: hypothetical protein [unclassified Crossiella]|uniref:hypothetical protein n=1 Tax=unclassified Crossiella TaxID=2620835 RepID=UPI001FFF0A31|nr:MULTISPECIES: hypothetical protein [unclassified Crossiella]MCK2244415.1 hypothetical protein [Crossiella sp. S99.2]MCK2257757.1 hypothetical protein [Crossiella sp. S99.1]
MGSPFIRATACALMLTITACGGPEKSPAPSGPPELSVADYQQKLTGLVDAARPLTEQLNPATTLEQLNQIRVQLSTALRAQHTEFGKFRPPKAAAVPHRELTDHLSSFATKEDLRTPATGGGNNSCGLPVPEALRLHQAKVNTRQALGNAVVRALPGEFGKVGVQFTGFPEPPEPAMPELETRRPRDGEVLQRGPGGSTTVTITNNSGKLDAVVSAVVGGDPAKPRASVFVRGDSTATLSGLSGPFELYYKFGNDFDPQRRGFTRDCEYRKLQDPLADQGPWSIGISKSDLRTIPLLRLTKNGNSDYRTATILKAAPF